MKPKVIFPDVSEYDGFCLDLVDELLERHPDGDILYVELSRKHPRWKYHAAMVLDGIVYDAWCPTVTGLTPEEYVKTVFGDTALSWELNPGAEED